ncbi:MAG: hypothetical protein M5U26_14675 [Planctomycetota bacterium]|nr:hypothetical protein [Planctomycetota bacterium]
MPLDRAERALKILLRAAGAVMLCALPFAFLPRAWLAGIHAALGLGAYPEGPVIDYLARTASLLYAGLGGLYLLLSRDLARFRPAIAYLAWTGLLFSVLMLGIDVSAGLPRWWVWGEGPVVAALSLALGLLNRSVGRPDPSA